MTFQFYGSKAWIGIYFFMFCITSTCHSMWSHKCSLIISYPVLILCKTAGSGDCSLILFLARLSWNTKGRWQEEAGKKRTILSWSH